MYFHYFGVIIETEKRLENGADVIWLKLHMNSSILKFSVYQVHHSNQLVDHLLHWSLHLLFMLFDWHFLILLRRKSRGTLPTFVLSIRYWSLCWFFLLRRIFRAWICLQLLTVEVPFILSLLPTYQQGFAICILNQILVTLLLRRILAKASSCLLHQFCWSFLS